MRVASWLFVLGVVGCSAPSPFIDGGGGGTAGAGGGAGGGGVQAPPADAGVPAFTAASFCDVFARTFCRWAVTCGQRTAAEEADCLAIKKHECPRPLGFDATAANVCLLRLEASRCSPSRPASCPAAWPAAVRDGGGCLSTRECAAGVCVGDGGACGQCGPAAAAGAPCDDFRPCDGDTRCAAGDDGGVQCIGRLDAGEKCLGLGDEACKSGRCLFKPSAGKVCASPSPGGSCTSSLGCAASLYCDPVRGGCRIPELLGALCDNQEACAGNGNACLGGKCTRVLPFSAAEGAACTETAQCTWGLACDIRAAAPKCVRRVAFDADCQLKGLDVWDPRCPYLAMCHPVKQVCADAASLCTFGGYCPTGPGRNEKCAAGAICRGLSSCVDEGDGGYRCLPTDSPAGQACFAQLASRACTDSTCVAGVCAAWPTAPACGP